MMDAHIEPKYDWRSNPPSISEAMDGMWTVVGISVVLKILCILFMMQAFHISSALPLA